MKKGIEWGWLALALAVVGGCAGTSPERIARNDQAHDLRQARVEFRQGTTSRGEITQASYSPRGKATAGVVTIIEFPHPDGDKDKALATVVVPGGATEKEQKPSRLAKLGSWADHMLPGLTLGEGGTKARALTIEKSELDELLRASVEQGALESSPAADSRLVIDINGARQTSHPESPAALREFASRVLREGRVVAIDHPHVAPYVAEQISQGQGVYESLEAQAAGEQP